MAFASLVEVKLADLRRCDKDGCNRWWHKTDFKLIGHDSHNIFLKCPHCREARTNPTKYWHGPPSGPREPAYDYPAKMPQTPLMPSLPSSSPGDRRSSTKRQMSSESTAATPTQNKKPKPQQATPAPTPTTSVAKTAKMVRKDSLGSTVAPATAKGELNLELLQSSTKRHFEEWKACKGRPATYMQKELEDAQTHLKTMQNSTPKIERTVRETQQKQAAAQAGLKRFEQLQEDNLISARKAGAHEGIHKPIMDTWLMQSKKHVQLAWEENNRCSKAWQTAMSDRAEARRIETEQKQKIENILEERKQLENFGVYVSALPAESNGA
ncbi:hypothetical protein M436DRAFT_81646 [Aureobasidium namibiae CBS 147.97]|uniref:Uncharacterized protein n=1 Tax=Aureobasidium namibiae CBS 147.97 TaxID=1043004 RepID=A0A074WNU5_9PEZI